MVANFRDQLTVVLHNPQRQINIAATVRAMMNMGIQHLRLVNPREYEPDLIEHVAHRSAGVVEKIEIYDSLPAALHDVTWAVGTTARHRETPTPPQEMRASAPSIVAKAHAGQRIALVFGPEDNGLQQAEIELCQQFVTIATDPDYASLNLAQAVLLVCYELNMTSPPERVDQRILHPPATVGSIDAFVVLLEQALREINFFKSPSAPYKIRSLRSMTHRAQPNAREIVLLAAIAHELISYVKKLRSKIPH